MTEKENEIMKKVMMVIGIALAMMTGGCTMVKAPGLTVASVGLNSEQVVSGLNVTRGTNGVYEVIIDSTSSKQSTEGLIQGLIALGSLARGMQAAPPPATGAVACPDCAGGNCSE